MRSKVLCDNEIRQGQTSLPCRLGILDWGFVGRSGECKVNDIKETFRTHCGRCVMRTGCCCSLLSGQRMFVVTEMRSTYCASSSSSPRLPRQGKQQNGIFSVVYFRVGLSPRALLSADLSRWRERKWGLWSDIVRPAHLIYLGVNA